MKELKKAELLGKMETADSRQQTADQSRNQSQNRVLEAGTMAYYEWTRSMRWAGVSPNVYRLEREYLRVKLTKSEMRLYEKRITRTPDITRWSVKITPHMRV